MGAPMESLKAGLASLHKSEEFSDLTLVCGPYYFKVHKAVVCAQSEYFRVGLQAGKFQEGDSGVFHLKASAGDGEDPSEALDDPEVVKIMIYYFYHLDYEVEKLPAPDKSEPHIAVEEVEYSTPSSRSQRIAMVKKRKGQAFAAPVVTLTNANMVDHAKVFAAATKYQVPGLVELAAEKFKAAVAENYRDATFAQALHIAYTSTVDGVRPLRQIVEDTLTDHDDLLDLDEVRTVVCSINELAYELLKRKRPLPKARW